MNSHGGGNSQTTKNGKTPKAKMVTFYRSGDVNFSGCRMAIAQKNYRNFETLLDELTNKVALSKGARRIHTPGGVHTVTSVEALEDGKSYVVTSSKKLEPLNLDSVQKQRVWKPTKKSMPSQKAMPNGTVTKLMPNGVKRSTRSRPSPPKERTPPNRDILSSKKASPTPKKIVIMRNGNFQNKHMMLLNRHTAQSFEDILQTISDMFNLPVRKLCTAEGIKVESLQGILNGPELFVALPGTERFRELNYVDNAPFKTSQPRQRSLRKLEDETDLPTAKIKSKGKWRVWIATNKNPSAGTDATVYMVVYGDHGKTDDIILGAGDGYFEAGNEDEFTIQIGDVGEIYKIRIGHDDSTEFPGWKCDEVRMEDVHTGEELVFACDRWMSRDEDDGDICRELVVSRGEDTLPVIRYQVFLTTGNYWGAGLDGKVYVTLIGERGDSGPRLLHRSDQAKPFEKGKTDVFTLEAVSLGSLKGILIGHDCDQPGGGWFLDEVVVRETEDNEREFTFPCYQWLDVAMEDGAITREISVDHLPLDFENDMWEKEKWKFATGNHVMLIHKTSGKALHVTGNGTVEAGADPYTKMSTAYFMVENLKKNLCVFSSSSKNDHILALENNRPSIQAKNNPLCGFNILMQIDSTLLLESNQSKQHLSFSVGGKPIDSRVARGPPQTFYCYTKGMFRTDGIILLYTSRIQTLMLDDCGRLHATGTRADNALWKVHKVKEGGIRMFENLSIPESYLQIKNGICNGKGEGDDFCHFKVHKIKDQGYIKLQSVVVPEYFVGFSPDGRAMPVLDDGLTCPQMYPAVVQVGITKKRLTPTPPLAPRQGNKKKRGVRVKKVSIIPEKPLKDALINSGIQPEPLDEEEKSFYEEGDWKVLVKTGTSGTSSTVILVVYGEKKVSEPIVLGKGGKLFTSGAEDEFNVNLSDIGEIYKIRVGLDTINKKASWRLDQVKMTDMNTGQQLTFRFKNRWLAMREDDGSVWREAAALRSGAKPLPINKYFVQITTGWEVGSATDAHVFVTLVGEKGDTGRRLLHRSADEGIFRDGQVNDFEIEAVSIQKLKSVIVEHDGDELGAGWFCKEILVKESKDSKSEYIFTCDRWLDGGKDDGLIKRELQLTEKRKIKENDWDVYISTGSDVGCSLSGPVTLVVYGDEGHTELMLAPTHGQGFRSSSVENFRVNIGDIGQLTKVRIGHSCSGSEQSWYLNSLQLKDMNMGTVLDFEVNRWLSPKHDDQDTWREFPITSDGKKAASVIKYLIHVYTGKEPGSGTEATVYLHLFGTHSDSGPRRLLRNNRKTFTVGQMDMFVVEAVGLGELQRVVVGHDGKEKGQGWYLEKIVVKDSRNVKNEYSFICKRWLDAGKDDGKIERELTTGKTVEETSAEVVAITDQSLKATGDSMTVTWSKASDKITGYLVTLRPLDDSPQEVRIDDPDTTKAEFTNLNGGLECEVDIVPLMGEELGVGSTLKGRTDSQILQVGNPSAASTTSTITLTWERPARGDLIGYKVSYSVPGGAATDMKINEPDTTEATIRYLVAGRQYRCEISTLYEEMSSSRVLLTQRTKPNQPTNIQVTDIKTDNLRLKWERPLGDLTGYVVKYRPISAHEEGGGEMKDRRSSKDESEKAVVNTTEWTEVPVDANREEMVLTELVPGQTYDVSLYTRSQSQMSDAYTLHPTTLPETVQDLTVSVAPTAVTLSWSPPASGKFDGYLVTCSQDEAVTSKELPPSENNVTFEGLSERQNYRVQVFAVSETGEKSEPAGETVTTVTTQDVPPVQCPEVSSSRDSITVKWQKPDFDTLTGYEVSCYQIGGAKQFTGEENERNGQASLGVLEEGGESAQMGDDLGERLTEKKEENGDSGVSSEADEGKISSPRKRVAPSLVDKLVFTTIVDAGGSEVVVRRLMSGTEYRVEIASLCEEQKSQVIAMETKTQSKPPPLLSMEYEAGENEIAVSWYTPPLDFTGYKAVCYKVPRVSQDENSSCDESNDAASVVKVDERILGSEATKVSFNGLEGDTPYLIEIFTLHGGIENEAADMVVYTAKPPKPPQVTDLSWETDESTFTVSWEKPTAAVTGFLVNIIRPSNPSELVISDPTSPGRTEEGSSDDTLTPQKMCRDGETGELIKCLVKGEVLEQRRLEADQTSTVFSALEMGTVYAVHVASLRGSAESDWVHFVAETAANADSLYPVLDLEASCTRDKILLTWSPPDGSVTGYRIKWSPLSKDIEGSMTENTDRERQEQRTDVFDADDADRILTDDSKNEGADKIEEDVAQSGQEKIDQVEDRIPTGDQVTENKEQRVASQSERGTLEKHQSENDNLNLEGEMDQSEEVEGKRPKDSHNIDKQNETDQSQKNEPKAGVVDVGAEISSYDIEGLAPCSYYNIQVWTLNGEDLSEPVEITAQTNGDWTVQLLTCDDTPPDQRTSLMMSVIGCSASEDHIPLTNGEEMLLKEPNIFQILAKEIDGIYKIRLEVRDVDLQSFKGIHVKQVSMVHNVTSQELIFEGDVWLRRHGANKTDGKTSTADKKLTPIEKASTEVISEEDKVGAASKDKDDSLSGTVHGDQRQKESLVEAPTDKAEKENEGPSGPSGNMRRVEEGISSEVTDDLIAELPLAGDTSLLVLTYRVEVNTKSIREAASTGTSAHITVHGSRGDTGKRELWQSDQEIRFQPGQVDVFFLQAVDIGHINKVTIEHDGKTPECDWLVEKVVVSDNADPTTQVTFPCDQWFSSTDGNKRTEMVLEPSALSLGEGAVESPLEGDEKGVSSPDEVEANEVGPSGEQIGEIEEDMSTERELSALREESDEEDRTDMTVSEDQASAEETGNGGETGNGDGDKQEVNQVEDEKAVESSKGNKDVEKQDTDEDENGGNVAGVNDEGKQEAKGKETMDKSVDDKKDTGEDEKGSYVTGGNDEGRQEAMDRERRDKSENEGGELTSKEQDNSGQDEGKDAGSEGEEDKGKEAEGKKGSGEEKTGKTDAAEGDPGEDEAGKKESSKE